MNVSAVIAIAAAAASVVAAVVAGAILARRDLRHTSIAHHPVGRDATVLPFGGAPRPLRDGAALYRTDRARQLLTAGPKDPAPEDTTAQR